MTYNIIQIVADDLGFGDVGYFNDGLTLTPNIDRLFAGGTRFGHAYSASPVCAPARAALLTGRYPHRTGAIDTLEGLGLDRLALDEKTIADAFRAGGYRTGLVGKWHNGALDPRYSPHRRGFESFFGFRGGWMDYWNWRLNRNDELVQGDGRYLTDVWGEAASEFVGAEDRRPFYLMLAFNAPHYPLQAHDADLASVRKRAPDITDEVATIYAMVEAMDRAIGRMLTSLETAGRADRTIILFTSDNGPDLSKGSARPNLEFRGQKTKVWEGGIRVPFAIYGPGIVPQDKEVEGVLHFVDLLPTLLEACSVAPPEGGLPVDGVSRWSSLSDTPPDGAARYWQWNRYTPIETCNAAVREGSWKLVYPEIPAAMKMMPEDIEMDVALKYQPELHPTIRPRDYRADVGDDNPAQLFDLGNDPHEKRDLAAEHPDVTARLAAQLHEWFVSVERDRERTRANTDPEVEA